MDTAPRYKCFRMKVFGVIVYGRESVGVTAGIQTHSNTQSDKREERKLASFGFHYFFCY